MLPVHLSNGYKRFRKSLTDRDQERFQHLRRHGQNPATMIIGCCDSRVDPTKIFDADHGSIFTLRNIANLVPALSVQQPHHSVPAAIEYAVQVLKVSHIVIIGHEKCGGIRASIDRKDHEEESLFIDGWLDTLDEPRSKVLKALPNGSPEEQADLLERTAILHSLENLRSLPFVRRAMEKDVLQLHAAYFLFGGADLLVYDWNAKKYVSVADQPLPNLN